MEKILQCIALLTCGIACTVGACAQTDVLPQTIPPQYPDYIISKTNSIDKKLEKETSKLLKKWHKQEERIKRKFARTDSLKVVAIFGDAEQQYKQIEQKLQNTTERYFIPTLDSLGTSLKFLQQNPKIIPGKNDEKLKEALEKVNALGNRFKNAEEIKRFLRERKEYLREQLKQFGDKYTRQLKQLNKQVYYYGEAIAEYKSLIQDQKKAQRKALELLSKTKAFKDFMRKNSQLASLFRLPADPDDPSSLAALAGLQTRAQINNLIDQQLSIGGPGAQQQFRQSIQEAQSQLNQLKEKAMKNASSGGNSGDDAEGFKPNNQKTKTFLQRLEIGTNFQSQKAQGYFPVTSDIGLSVGYKLNEKSIIGLGASYKLGLGKDIRHIRISHQGLGLRSFVDWRIKGSFSLSGGYEMNYRNVINNIAVLKNLGAWQQSGLLGLSKIISLQTNSKAFKVFKKTKLQLLWDFLSYQQVPRAQPVVFRVGYSF
jgi:hypothetical protein